MKILSKITDDILLESWSIFYSKADVVKFVRILEAYKRQLKWEDNIGGFIYVFIKQATRQQRTQLYIQMTDENNFKNKQL